MNQVKLRTFVLRKKWRMRTYPNQELLSYHSETTAQRQLIFAHIRVQGTAPVGQFVLESSLKSKRQKNNYTKVS
jgi:hypothetical protein